MHILCDMLTAEFVCRAFSTTPGTAIREPPSAVEAVLFALIVGLCAEHADDVSVAEAFVSSSDTGENEGEFVGERLIAECVTYLREYRSFYHPHVRLQVIAEQSGPLEPLAPFACELGKSFP